MNDIRDAGKNTLLNELLKKIDDIIQSPLPTSNIHESILGEYLRFINLSEGALMLCVFGQLLALARHTGDHFVEPYEWRMLHPQASCKHLMKNHHTHVLNDVEISWLDESGATQWQRNSDQTVLLIPLVVEDEVLGAIVIVPPLGYSIPQNDIEAGEIIAVRVSKYLKEQRRLSQSQRSALLARKVARISEAIRSISNPAQLLNESLRLIRDEIGFYFVGFYRVDRDRGWAFLQAATGKMGQNMIARAHPLPLANEATLVGWVFKHHRPRMALDIGDKAVRFEDPLIPDTRSEIMLPVGKEYLIGILGISSFEPAAFSEEDIPLLRILSDELAIALQKTQDAAI